MRTRTAYFRPDLPTRKASWLLLLAILAHSVTGFAEDRSAESSGHRCAAVAGLENETEREGGRPVALQPAPALSHPRGLEGIRLFARLDRSPRKVFQQGTPKQAGFLRLEYRPSTGEWLCTEYYNDPSGALVGRGWTYNEHTGVLEDNTSLRGSYSSSFAPVYAAEAKASFEKHREAFREKLGITQPTAPKDYPGVDAVLSEVLSSKPVDDKTLQPGDFVLFEDESWLKPVLVLSRYAASQDTPGIGHTIGFEYSDLLGGIELRIPMSDEGGKLKRDRTRPLSSDLMTEGTSGHNINFGQKGLEDEGRPRRIWKLDARQAADIARYHSVKNDPLADSSFTREEWTVRMALQHLQYNRWGQDHIAYTADGNRAFESSLKEHYDALTSERYRSAINALIARVGTENFSRAVTGLFQEHLEKLHTQHHLKNGPFGPHSDIPAYGREQAEVAEDAMLGILPLPETDMRDNGYVVNARPLFADEYFWEALKRDHSSLFTSLVDAVPRVYRQKGGPYGVNVQIDTAALTKEYFPAAFHLLHGQRADFDSNGPALAKIE